MVIVSGFHLFPIRTEKLSPSAPMVLHTRGRVGSRRFLEKRSPLENVPKDSFVFVRKYVRVWPSKHPKDAIFRMLTGEGAMNVECLTLNVDGLSQISY